MLSLGRSSRALAGKRARSIAIALAALAPTILVGATAPSPVAAAKPAPFVSEWIAHWNTSEATKGLDAADPTLLTEMSPFWFSPSETGGVRLIDPKSEPALKALITKLRGKGLQVWPTIADGTGPRVVYGFLADPITRVAHADAIVAWTTDGVRWGGTGFDGIDLDYENFAFSDKLSASEKETLKANWILFIQDLSVKLHAAGKKLAVTTPPIWYDDAKPNTPRTVASWAYTYYAWKDILPFVDRLRPMVYDWSVGSPGPLAPMSWVDNVIAYITDTFANPAERAKFQLGVPTYGRNWVTAFVGACTDEQKKRQDPTMVQALQLATDQGVVPSPDGQGGLKFTYDRGYLSTVTGAGAGSAGTTTPTSVAPAVPSAADPVGLLPAIRVSSCATKRVVYFTDPASVVRRADAALDAGLGGIVLWAAGYEDLSMWPALAAYDPATYVPPPL